MISVSVCTSLLGSCQDETGCGVSVTEGMGLAGRAVVRSMEHEFGNVISAYTDADALADGVLVQISAAPVNRVTRAVFDHFASPLGSSPVTGQVTDIGPLLEAIRAMLAVKEDDGLRCGTYQGKKLWLVPNEVDGLTLMFPEDY